MLEMFTDLSITRFLVLFDSLGKKASFLFGFIYDFRREPIYDVNYELFVLLLRTLGLNIFSD